MVRRRNGMVYELTPGRPGPWLGQQNFVHGRFDWLHYPDDLTADGLLVAQVTIHPGAEWPEHLHGGYEQMLYVLSGRGVHWVNGEEKVLLPGQAHFLPANAVHTMINTGDEPLVHLSVYHPRKPEVIREITSAMQHPKPEPDQRDLPLSDVLSVSTMQKIQDDFSTAVGLGVITITQDGSEFTRPTGLPAFCQYVRSSNDGEHACRAFDPRTGRVAHDRGRPTLFNCCLGVVCIAVPLLVGHELSGHLACGFVRLEEPSEGSLAAVRQKAILLGLDPHRLEQHYRDMEMVLQAQMVAAAESLQSIANSVLSLSVRERQRRIESQHAAEMVKKLRLVSQLENALQESEFRALEARINPHFLFNALNTIAGEVAERGREAEEVLYALSDFLRFSLRHAKSTATLAEEMVCLDNYLRIQRARFGEGFKTVVKVDQGAVDLLVPSMILQPLVENSILHGLAPRGYTGRIAVCARRWKGRLRIDVADSGTGFRKLQHSFGDDYAFLVRSIAGHGTCVTINMPARHDAGRTPP